MEDIMVSIPEIPNEYLQEIGFLAIETAWIDRAIVDFIARLAFDDEDHKVKTKKAECLVGGEPSGELLSKLNKLFTVLIDDADLGKEFKEIIKLIDEVHTDRSNYMHSCLNYSGGWQNVPPEVRGFKIQRDMNKNTKEMRKLVVAILPDLTKAASKARNTHNVLMMFTWKVHKYLKTKNPAKSN